MKTVLITAMAALLIAGAGCTCISSARNDEAKVVARILAKSASAPLAFKDQRAGQELISFLDTSEHFAFGVILDGKRKVFASYSRPDQVSEKEKFLARVAQASPANTLEAFAVNDGVAIATVQVGEQTIGYVAVARKGH
ncbi:MAG TPA: CHASE sensor domain-containing protein [Verrucomicrobiae bacterium]|nr:CHASE sensor domain-containing protein [Verrucomicrobiae bacterium]